MKGIKNNASDVLGIERFENQFSKNAEKKLLKQQVPVFLWQQPKNVFAEGICKRNRLKKRISIKINFRKVKGRRNFQRNFRRSFKKKICLRKPFPKGLLNKLLNKLPKKSIEGENIIKEMRKILPKKSPKKFRGGKKT